MDALVRELWECGALDQAGLAWATAYRSEHSVPFDTALLELDLVDEESLLKALEACSGIKAARPADLALAEPGLARKLPIGFSRSFGICPLKLADGELVALTLGPLPQESVQELRELFGLSVRQLIAPSHYVQMGHAQVYGSDPGERVRAVEARLAMRRTADVRKTLDSIQGAATFAAVARLVLEYADCLLEHACFLAYGDQGLRVVATAGKHDSSKSPTTFGPESALGPAIRHGGFFLGRVIGNRQDEALFEWLGRPPPHSVLIAPVASTGRTAVVLCADNGPRGIAQRWAAELTLLCARLGQARRGPSERGTPEEAAPVPETPPSAEADPGLPEADRAALERLRQAARNEGLALEAFVDLLLHEHAARPAADSSAAVVGEVKGLFERLATDIPAHLARGMEAAFKDLVPRLAGAAAPSVPGDARATPPAARTPSAAASVDLVSVSAAPKEVPSYQSKRRKASRVKL